MRQERDEKYANSAHCSEPLQGFWENWGKLLPQPWKVDRLPGADKDVSQRGHLRGGHRFFFVHACCLVCRRLRRLLVTAHIR